MTQSALDETTSHVAARRLGARLPEFHVDVVNAEQPSPSWISADLTRHQKMILIGKGVIDLLREWLEAPLRDGAWIWRHSQSVSRGLLFLVVPLVVSYLLVYPVIHLSPIAKLATFFGMVALVFVGVSWMCFASKQIARWGASFVNNLMNRGAKKARDLAK